MGRPPKTSCLNFWEHLRAFPPIMVRLSARRATAGKNVSALSGPEVAIASGIPLSRLLAISRLFSWDEVTLGEAERFCAACGFDPTNPAHRRRQREYIRTCRKKYPNRPPHYLRHSPHWETEFLPLIQRLKSQPTSSPDSSRSLSPTQKSAA